LRKINNHKILFLFTILLAACGKKNDIPSLYETYANTDKNPFGSYVLYDAVQHFFVNNSVETQNEKLSNAFTYANYKKAVYINVSKNFFLDDNDANALIMFIENGNTAFIAAENIDTLFLNKIGIATANPKNELDGFVEAMEHTTIKVDPALYKKDLPTQYSFFYNKFDNHFDTLNTNVAGILGINDDGMPNFVVSRLGKGRVYVHCEPRAFSNYFLLQKNNIKYIEQTFAFMPQKPSSIIWDDYYHKRNTRVDKNSASGLRVLFKYPAMKWAFLLLVSILLLYLLVGSKRKQRIVPILPKADNTTMLFTETVARLYLQEKDNRNIADKMVTYFFEHIRNQYYLSTNVLNEDFLISLSKKSGTILEDTKKLFASIENVQQTNQVTDDQLLQLNHLIEKFYKTNH
jgi:hypothetical protein